LHGDEALGIAEPICIELADGSNNIARQFCPAQLGAPDEVCRAIIDVERGDEVLSGFR
jgi:hypothetical protein